MSLEIVSTGAVGALAGIITEFVAQSKKIKVTGPLEKLRVEADRQELAARIAESQARVAQELARDMSKCCGRRLRRSS